MRHLQWRGTWSPLLSCWPIRCRFLYAFGRHGEHETSCALGRMGYSLLSCAPSMASNSSDHQVNSCINAIVPLAVLRTLQQLDHTDAVDLEEYAGEVSPKRLGMSATVSAQVERYEKLVKRGAVVDPDEVAQLFRLVGRRNDADLAFSQAGRVAAEEMLKQTSAASRLVHRAGRVVARQRADWALAMRLADRLLGASMSFDEESGIEAVANGQLTGVISDGKPCEFFGAALAELLRRCTDFEGAMFHRKCRFRGDDVCSWHSGNSNGR